jgi:acetyl esterase/lipase
MGTKTSSRTKKKPRKQSLSFKISKSKNIGKKGGAAGSWLHHHWRVPVIVISCLLLLGIAVRITFEASPWPKALLIRHAFQEGGAKMNESVAKYVPSDIVTGQKQQYRPNDKDAYLTPFYPYTADQDNTQLPTIVWVHGGAWISGSTSTISNYLKVVAGKGYTVIGVDYSIAPGKTYPTPIVQVNDALSYIQANAQKLHVNPSKIVLAGDSAGSQIASQVANIVTSPAYAKQMYMKPGMPGANLKGAVLNCGAYDLALANYNGASGDFLRTVLWSYTGTKHFVSDPDLQMASVARYVTAAFPPTFITAGNDDPLESQSREMAKRLQEVGVSVDPLFYPPNYQPPLQHEYQFKLDTPEGRQALEHITAFLQKQLQ